MDLLFQWKCCAVEEHGWADYQQSEWYRLQPGTPRKYRLYLYNSNSYTVPLGTRPEALTVVSSDTIRVFEQRSSLNVLNVSKYAMQCHAAGSQ